MSRLEEVQHQAEALPEVVREDLLLDSRYTFLPEPTKEGLYREDDVIVAPRTLAFVMAMNDHWPTGTIQPKIGRDVKDADEYFGWSKSVISFGAGRHHERSLMRLALHPNRTAPFNTMDAFMLECVNTGGIYNRDFLGGFLLTNWIGSATRLMKYWEEGCRSAKDIRELRDRELDELIRLERGEVE